MFCSLWEETPWGAVLQRIKVPFMPFELYWKTFRQVTWCNHCLRLPCIALLLQLFKGTACFWDEIEKRENRTLLEVVNSFRCVGARCSSLPKAPHHLLLRSSHAPDFCGSSEERCFCILSSAQILTDASRNMDVGLDVPPGKDS